MLTTMCLLAGGAQDRTVKEAADSLASQLLADEPEAANGDAGGGGGGDGLLEAPASADSRYASVVKKLFTNTETFEITEKCLKWKWICRLDDKVVRPPWYRPPLFSSALLLTTTNALTRPLSPRSPRARSIAIALVRSCARALVRSCARALVRSCAPALVRSCAPALVRSCARALRGK